MTSGQFAGGMFLRFVDTFSADCRPDVLSMSGGEALLRPELVRQLGERARRSGTRSSVLSGMFFATAGRIPPEIRAAIDAVDHFSASIDAFHERQVPRTAVFRALETLLADGKQVSVRIVGKDASDPYIADIVDDVRRVFDDRVPMLVRAVSGFGRALTWLRRDTATASGQADADPCARAAWPVVGFDGTIVACGNDDVLDGVPPHLRLGHASVDDWATVRAHSTTSSMIRSIRLFGPEYVAQEFSDVPARCDGYCRTCTRLSHDPKVAERVHAIMAKRSIQALEAEATALQQKAGALLFARRHGLPDYAELALLGTSA